MFPPPRCGRRIANSPIHLHFALSNATVNSLWEGFHFHFAKTWGGAEILFSSASSQFFNPFLCTSNQQNYELGYDSASESFILTSILNKAYLRSINIFVDIMLHCLYVFESNKIYACCTANECIIGAKNFLLFIIQFRAIIASFYP